MPTAIAVTTNVRPMRNLPCDVQWWHRSTHASTGGVRITLATITAVWLRTAELSSANVTVRRIPLRTKRVCRSEHLPYRLLKLSPIDAIWARGNAGNCKREGTLVIYISGLVRLTFPREVDHYEVLDRNAGLSDNKCGAIGAGDVSAPRRAG